MVSSGDDDSFGDEGGKREKQEANAYLAGFLFLVLLPCFVSLVATGHFWEEGRTDEGVDAPDLMLMSGQAEVRRVEDVCLGRRREWARVVVIKCNLQLLS
jgi:hypothetical protein